MNKPINNGRSWWAEFQPGSRGEKAIESLGLRCDHLRHDLLALDAQHAAATARADAAESTLAAREVEVGRLRKQLEAAHAIAVSLGVPTSLTYALTPPTNTEPRP